MKLQSSFIVAGVGTGRARGFHRVDVRFSLDWCIILIFGYLSRTVNDCKENPNFLPMDREFGFRGWVRVFHEKEVRNCSQVCQKVAYVSSRMKFLNNLSIKICVCGGGANRYNYEFLLHKRLF